MKAFMKFTLWIMSGVLAASNLSAQEKPNIVMFYIDDWAWNGSPVAMDDSMANSCMPVLQMPNVEKLAKGGMKFRNAYGSPQCSPARACVQTGQSNPRNGLTVYLNSPNPYYDTQEEYRGFPLIPNVAAKELDDDAVTIAEALKPLGYVSAHVGKWHMRGDPGKEGYIVHDGDTTNDPGNTLKQGLQKGEPTPRRLPKDMSDPKLMFSVTEKAIGFIEAQAKAGHPFYVQISHYAMHAGRECLDKTREKYVHHPLVQAWYKKHKKDPDTVKRKEDPANWLAMGEDLDGRIGAVLAKVKELGIEDNTYFIVVADNGYRHEELQITPGLKQPLHARKWWLWDGGIRVPMIVKGPGIKSGSVFTGNVINYDFLPTFVDWAGGDSKQLQNIDGVSLAEYMAGKKPDESFLNRNLYFHYPHYRSGVPHSAMISGPLKVIHFYAEPDVPMLFDVSKDMGEVSNIAKQQPETHRKLYEKMMGYLKEVNARFPKVNLDYDPEVYRQDRKTKERLLWGPFEGQRVLEEDEIL
ncbi:sulfatase-like hydrolase/transferase [Planctomycetota bacterium]